MDLILEDSFIDPEFVRNNVIDHLVQKSKVRCDGELYKWDANKIEKVKALTDEEIIFLCSPEHFQIP